MSRFFVCFLLVIAANVSIAGIYKYTDEQGNVHFTDKPVSGAKKIKENKHKKKQKEKKWKKN